MNSSDAEKRIFELGCGNGSVSNELTKHGFDMIGIDLSLDGIRYANDHYPHLKLFHGSAYDQLAEDYGQFPIVLSLEVIEHLYHPRKFVSAVSDLLLPGGTAVIFTPYHGCWKNLALAITGKMDEHFTALWDYGHIKFRFTKTLQILLREGGFNDLSFVRVGRVPLFAKSMIAMVKKGSECQSQP
jgi:2-polyprenyl-6-hydroxyphenyl methylase/3-demethylubiquinone-9 3-methyltransferase